jgi:hypothetical protein
MVQWHPTFAAESDRGVWAQVLRGLMFCGIGIVTIVSAFALSGLAVNGWDTMQTNHAEDTRWSELGLRRVCANELTPACVKRVSRSAGVDVALARGGFGDVVVPVGTAKAEAVDALEPSPTYTMIGHFDAAHYASLHVDQGSLLAANVYSAPTALPAYPYQVIGTFPIDGVDVEFRTAPQYTCKADEIDPRYCPTNVWASWHRNGLLYAANFVSYRSTVTPEYLRAPGETMSLLMPKIIYTDES